MWNQFNKEFTQLSLKKLKFIDFEISVKINYDVQ